MNLDMLQVLCPRGFKAMPVKYHTKGGGKRKGFDIVDENMDIQLSAEPTWNVRTGKCWLVNIYGDHNKELRIGWWPSLQEVKRLIPKLQSGFTGYTLDTPVGKEQ